MHIEVIIEDVSGKRALELLLPKILGDSATFKIHSYKGIGSIPKGMKDPKDASKRILLQNLPKLLKGYGRAFAGYGTVYRASVVVVCDLDEREREVFLGELQQILDACDPQPTTRFCLAIEEGEAWFLGDLPAIRAVYPKAKDEVLLDYLNDSICGTWETLADAIYAGGSRSLVRKGWMVVGAEKSRWAMTIPPRMNIDDNQSLSFCQFRDSVRALVKDS